MTDDGPAHSSASHNKGSDQPPPGTQGIDYIAVNESEQFTSLRRTQRSFVFPMAAFFILWYAAYVLLGAYAHDFMARPVFGSVNMGIVLGLGQFVTTFAITSIYVVFANRRLDPQAQAIRADLEEQEARA